MKKLSCMIIEDEPVARKIIREYIDDIDFLETVAEAENAEDATKVLRENNISILFLDIQMPGINGIEFLKKNTDDRMVIMTTAYPQYALQGFELDVMDYLVKPIPFDRFLKAVNKCRDYEQMKSGGVDKDALFIKCDRRIEKVMIQDIQYVKGMANYVIIHTAQRKYITYFRFKDIEEQLPSDHFARVHKSYIVALNSVNTIAANKVFIGSLGLPVSKFYRNSFIKKIEPLLLKRKA